MQQKENRSFKIITAIALCVAVLCLAVAYATLSQNLEVKGSADVQVANWKIGVPSDSGVSTSKGGSDKVDVQTSVSDTIGKTTVDITATLALPGDHVEVTVPIKNEGEIDAVLSDIQNYNTPISCKGQSEAETRTTDENIICQDAGNSAPGVSYTVSYDGTEIKNGISDVTTSELGTGVTKNAVITVKYDNAATKIPTAPVTVTLPEIIFVYDQDMSN